MSPSSNVQFPQVFFNILHPTHSRMSYDYVRLSRPEFILGIVSNKGSFKTSISATLSSSLNVIDSDDFGFWLSMNTLKLNEYDGCVFECGTNVIDAYIHYQLGSIDENNYQVKLDLYFGVRISGYASGFFAIGGRSYGLYRNRLR